MTFYIGNMSVHMLQTALFIIGLSAIYWGFRPTLKAAKQGSSVACSPPKGSRAVAFWAGLGFLGALAFAPPFALTAPQQARERVKHQELNISKERAQHEAAADTVTMPALQVDLEAAKQEQLRKNQAFIDAILNGER